MAKPKPNLVNRTDDKKTGAEYDRSTDHLSSQQAAKELADKVEAEKSEDE